MTGTICDICKKPIDTKTDEYWSFKSHKWFTDGAEPFFDYDNIDICHSCGEKILEFIKKEKKE